MKTFISYLIVIAILPVFLSSCKKDKDENAKLKLLTEKTWHITQYQYREFSTDPWDIEDVTDPCELDDIFTFVDNGTYNYVEGPTKCDPLDPDLIDSGTWSFQTNETLLRITSGGDTIDFTIEQLDANTLMIMYYDASGPEHLRIIFHH